MGPRAIIVGSSGQDGRILGAQLRNRGYEVTGCTRSGLEADRADLCEGTFDIRVRDAVARLIASFRPNEVYFLAAHHQSSEGANGNFADDLEAGYQVHVSALINFLEAMRAHSPDTRLFYAASSHIFGRPEVSPQDETTPINPTSAYGISKAVGVSVCRHYRSRWGTFASVGILYNHESEWRSEVFLSQRLARGVADIVAGRADSLKLGNLDARVDWGYAPDYTEAMQRILAADAPGDFVIASGCSHSVRDFARLAFEAVGLDYEKFVVVDPGLVHRDAGGLVGNPGRLIAATGWQPSIAFPDMVRRLVEHQLSLQGKASPQAHIRKPGSR